MRMGCSVTDLPACGQGVRWVCAFRGRNTSCPRRCAGRLRIAAGIRTRYVRRTDTRRLAEVKRGGRRGGWYYDQITETSQS
jgi:hypothetical protein